MNELSFLDLVILRKVDAESTVERFGSMINTSFFETANLLGTVKIKGYIGIESSVGGISRVTMTDAGNSILTVADQRAAEPIEALDNAILHAIGGGARELEQLQSALNVRSADLAFHINKLVSQGFMDYEVRSAKVYFLLSEMGFNATGGVKVQSTLATPAQPQMASKEPSEEEMASQLAKKEGQSQPQKKEEKAVAPPWVKPADVKPKEDVAHILGTEHSRKAAHAPRREAAPKAEAKMPLSPDEEKRMEKHRRFASKLEYYLVEYAPYLIMILVVLLIFTGALFLSLTKMS